MWIRLGCGLRFEMQGKIWDAGQDLGCGARFGMRGKIWDARQDLG